METKVRHLKHFFFINVYSKNRIELNFQHFKNVDQWSGIYSGYLILNRFLLFSRTLDYTFRILYFSIESLNSNIFHSCTSMKSVEQFRMSVLNLMMASFPSVTLILTIQESGVLRFRLVVTANAPTSPEKSRPQLPYTVKEIIIKEYDYKK